VDLSLLIGQAVVNGLVVGLLYLLMAVGFTLVFGVMRIVNFAHAEFYMLGAFVTFICVTRFELPFLPSVALTFVVAVVVGWVIEWAVLKPFRHDELNGMIATIGLAMILQNGALMLFGPDPQSMPSVATGVLRLGDLLVPNSRVYVVLCSAAVLLEIAQIQGIKARLIYPLGFGLGVGLAAVAGGLMAPLFSVSPFIGAGPMLKAFIVVILGGLGSIPGAALASLLLGITESVAGTFLSTSTADILIFALVIGMLVVRPSGLLGRPE
jgi:branched-chain amino acid transport system permease protein